MSIKMTAARNIIRPLLEAAGVDTKQKSKDGEFPFILVAWCESVAAVESLIKASKNVNAFDHKTKYAAIQCVVWAGLDGDTIELLDNVRGENGELLISPEEADTIEKVI